MLPIVLHADVDHAAPNGPQINDSVNHFPCEFFECAFSSRNYDKILWSKRCTCMASFRCACACEMLNCRFDGTLCYRLNICTLSHRCASVCDSYSCPFDGNLDFEKNGQNERRILEIRMSIKKICKKNEMNNKVFFILIFFLLFFELETEIDSYLCHNIHICMAYNRCEFEYVCWESMNDWMLFRKFDTCVVCRMCE